MSKAKAKLLGTMLNECQTHIQLKVDSTGEDLKQMVANLAISTLVDARYVDYRSWKLSNIAITQILNILPAEVAVEHDLGDIEALMLNLESDSVHAADCHTTLLQFNARLQSAKREAFKSTEPIDETPSFADAVKEVEDQGPSGEPDKK